MIRTGMRGIIELIRKHPKIRRILRCESPYFHHCSICQRSLYIGESVVIEIAHGGAACNRPSVERRLANGPLASWFQVLRRLPPCIDHLTRCSWQDRHMGYICDTCGTPAPRCVSRTARSSGLRARHVHRALCRVIGQRRSASNDCTSCCS